MQRQRPDVHDPVRRARDVAPTSGAHPTARFKVRTPAGRCKCRMRRNSQARRRRARAAVARGVQRRRARAAAVGWRRVGRSGGRGRSRRAIGGCPVFPANNAWNQNVSKLPVRSDSATLDRAASARPAGRRSCTPTSAAAARTASRSWSCPRRRSEGADPLHRVRRRERSRSVPDPAERAGRRRLVERRRPSRARRAAGHVPSVRARTTRSGAATTGTRTSGVNWNLTSNKLRPLGWTSADAAGLPILPGLVRYDEVAGRRDPPRGALHRAGDADAATSSRRRTTRRRRPNATLPPMGLRLRLKASYRPRRASTASRS